MDFSGPDATDFANVARLNHAFLLRLRRHRDGGPLRARLPAAIRSLAAGLGDLQIERLSAVPFLLLSLRERDEDYWRSLIAADANYDLFDAAAPPPHPDQLGAAALSFLWHTARRNAYAARLVSGATLAWCERLSECTLLDLLQQTAQRDDWIEPRLADHESLWSKLFGAGLSEKHDVRRAAHMTALQVVLTSDPFGGYRPMRAAACNVAMPSMSVADTGDRR